MAARTYTQQFAKMIKDLGDYRAKHGSKLTAANIDLTLFNVGTAAMNALDAANAYLNTYQP